MSRKQRQREAPLLPGIEPGRFADPVVRRTLQVVLAVVEELAQANAELRAENQALRDELAHLKGEQGQPTIRPAAPRPAATDHSSEAARRTPIPRTPHAKTALL